MAPGPPTEFEELDWDELLDELDEEDDELELLEDSELDDEELDELNERSDELDEEDELELLLDDELLEDSELDEDDELKVSSEEELEELDELELLELLDELKLELLLELLLLDEDELLELCEANPTAPGGGTGTRKNTDRRIGSARRRRAISAASHFASRNIPNISCWCAARRFVTSVGCVTSPRWTSSRLALVIVSGEVASRLICLRSSGGSLMPLYVFQYSKIKATSDTHASGVDSRIFLTPGCVVRYRSA